MYFFYFSHVYNICIKVYENKIIYINEIADIFLFSCINLIFYLFIDEIYMYIKKKRIDCSVINKIFYKQ